MPSVPKEVFQRIRRLQIKTTKEASDLFAGAYRSIFKGKGLEFEDARAYESGDDIRNIDWNVTARLNHPFVKTFREERELTVVLVVDISSSTYFSSHSRSKKELFAEIAAVLAFSAIKNNDKVGLILFSNEIELYIPPKRGLRHVLRIIRELLLFKPRYKGTDMVKALSFLGKIQRKRAVCFLCSDFFCSDFTYDAALIAKKHDLIAVSINDPLEQIFPPAGLIDFQDLESTERIVIDTSLPAVRESFRLAVNKQRDSIQCLMKRIGASYISILTDQPYVESLRRFFKVRRSR